MSLLVLNIGISFSATATTCPLRGFRPVRASRLLTLKAPKPRSSTRLPHASASVIVPRMVLTTASTSRWYRCGFCSAILAINSDLIIKGKRLRIECDRLVDQLGDIEIAIHGTPAEFPFAWRTRLDETVIVVRPAGRLVLPWCERARC